MSNKTYLDISQIILSEPVESSHSLSDSWSSHEKQVYSREFFNRKDHSRNIIEHFLEIIILCFFLLFIFTIIFVITILFQMSIIALLL